MRIVLADDDPDDQVLVREALGEAGLPTDLRTVGDGLELLEYLRAEGRHAGAPPADLVLLDLNMPRMSGHEALEEIRKDPRLRAIPVVVLSTSSHDDDVLRTYALGGNSFITKPPSFPGLVEVMRALDRYWFRLVEIPAGR
jgi:CheY-like chemotaxis protein